MEAMPDTTIVSSRGQITLPARLRKRLGIKSGDVILLEERGHEVVLKPGAVVPIDYYSDDQVAEWDREDRLPQQDKQRILKAIPKEEF